ncbi:MAG: VOC family protein [Haloferacaceae archaeon]
MPSDTPGIHHVTAIGSDPGRNLSFYTERLGLGLVKRSVNQDDVSVYHLFYGDRTGSPGTSMTFFPYPDARPGRVGTGQVSTTAFLIPGEAVEYWTDRLAAAGIDADEPRERFGDAVIPFRDPDGLPLELVARDDAPAGDPPEGPVPEEYAIRGFFGVTLSLASAESAVGLLEAMGYDPADRDGRRRRFRSSGDLGYVVDVVEDPELPEGRPGAGTVHHVAFRVTAAEQAEWREMLIDRGLRPTRIIDRKWFESVYARTPGGVLFEFATEGPGYTVDEPADELGERLVLPEWLEDRRGEIEAGLPDLDPGNGP